MKEEVSYFVYIVRCRDGTLYTGCTTNIEKRISVHNAGKGAKYTKTRIPVICVYQEQGIGRSWAQKREYEIKRMTKLQKIKLIQESGVR